MFCRGRKPRGMQKHPVQAPAARTDEINGICAMKAHCLQEEAVRLFDYKNISGVSHEKHT